MFKAIAIDGPSGAGKSTIARTIAGMLSYIYVDTGALYRAIALYCACNNINTKSVDNVINVLPNINVSLVYKDGIQCVILNDEDVSKEIRSPHISMLASNVSAITQVREFLLCLQRDIAEKNNVIMDGRDIGTVILPNADVKIFLTATVEERAKRRYAELIDNGQIVDFKALLAEISMRDYNDSTRDIAPLKQADDAILVDTSGYELERSIEVILKIIKDRLEAV